MENKLKIDLALKNGWVKEYIEGNGIDSKMWVSPDKKSAFYELPENLDSMIDFHITSKTAEILEIKFNSSREHNNKLMELLDQGYKVLEPYRFTENTMVVVLYKIKE